MAGQLTLTFRGELVAWALEHGGRILPRPPAWGDGPWLQVVVATYNPMLGCTTLGVRELTPAEGRRVRTHGPGDYYLP